jgi:hypothetical protein
VHRPEQCRPGLAVPFVRAGLANVASSSPSTTPRSHVVAKIRNNYCPRFLLYPKIRLLLIEYRFLSKRRKTTALCMIVFVPGRTQDKISLLSRIG